MFSDKDLTIKKIMAKKVKEKIQSPCQKILLINSQYVLKEDFSIDKALRNRYWSYPPYGCGVLANKLESRGYETKIIDLNFEMLQTAHQEKHKFRYDFWEDKLANCLQMFNPDLVGISCMFTMSHKVMKNIADFIKDYNEECPVICGGVHPTGARELILTDCPNIDFIGTHEGDLAFPNLIDFVNDKTDKSVLTQLAALVDGNYLFIDRQAMFSNQEINVVPLYQDLAIEEYNLVGQIGGFEHMRRGRIAAPILTSRGCRGNCDFCSVRTFYGPGVRQRKIESVLTEIQFLVDTYGIKHLTLLDDDPLCNQEEALALFRELTKKLDLTWDASIGLIATAITPEIIETMAASGCVGFCIGLESGNPEILKKIHKPATIESFRKCKRIIDQFPQLFVRAFLMIGFPGETLAQILDTINLSLELQFDWYNVQVLNPLPSTKIYDQMVEQGFIQDRLATIEEAYLVGSHGRQDAREEKEKLSARPFSDIFSTGHLEVEPQRNQLEDCWFLVDYKTNYEIVLGLTDPLKISKKREMLLEICQRMAPENPIAQLYEGLIEKRLGNDVQARHRWQLAENLVKESKYWQERFRALKLYDLLVTIS